MSERITIGGILSINMITILLSTAATPKSTTIATVSIVVIAAGAIGKQTYNHRRDLIHSFDNQPVRYCRNHSKCHYYYCNYCGDSYNYYWGVVLSRSSDRYRLYQLYLVISADFLDLEWWSDRSIWRQLTIFQPIC